MKLPRDPTEAHDSELGASLFFLVPAYGIVLHNSSLQESVIQIMSTCLKKAY